MRSLVILPCFLLLGASVVQAQAGPAAKPAALHWGPAPAVFPAGAKMAVVSGDPGKAAPFSVELSMPSGYRIPPHFHPTDESVEVKQGTFLVGMGDKFDAGQTKPMKVGDSATIVAVSAMGPFAMTYVNPADDPQKHAAKP